MARRRGGGAAAVDQDPHGGGSSGSRAPGTRDAFLDRARELLYTRLEEAAETIEDATWTRAELVKRLVKYFMGGVNHSLGAEGQPWDAAVASLVQNAMGSYSSSCQERDWFYELELGDVFAHVSWELVRHRRDRVEYGQVKDFAVGEYQTYLDEALQQKAFWLVVERTFEDPGSHSKLCRVLMNTYRAALDKVLEDTRPLDELERLMAFMDRWMRDALDRCWNALQSSPQPLTEPLAVALFKRLVCPFGETNEYSCVPQIFIENVGRPPPNWAFIGQTCRSIFRSWEGLASAPSSKRRKGAARQGGEELRDEPPRAVARDRSPAPSLDDPALDAHEGHPRCTTSEECVGSPEDRLIRHVQAGGVPGDIYCESCWRVFLEQNSALSGEPVD